MFGFAVYVMSGGKSASEVGCQIQYPLKRKRNVIGVNKDSDDKMSKLLPNECRTNRLVINHHRGNKQLHKRYPHLKNKYEDMYTSPHNESLNKKKNQCMREIDKGVKYFINT